MHQDACCRSVQLRRDPGRVDFDGEHPQPSLPEPRSLMPVKVNAATEQGCLRAA